MDVQKKRIRKEFQPLSVAVSLKTLTPGSSSSQVFDVSTGEYNPDRSVTPFVLLPEVIAKVSDGSWDNPYANSLLSEMKWFINGKDISTIVSWAGKYSVETVGSHKGAITISRNISSNENAEIHFEGIVADMRLGVNIPIKSDVMMLTTIDKSEDSYSISIGDSQIIRYNPFADRLLIYDYQVANSLIQPSSTERSKALNENAYERTIPILVYKGVNKITSGVHIYLYEIKPDGTLSLIVPASYPGVIQLSLEVLKLDLRLIEKLDFLIVVREEAIEKARIQLSVNRIYPSFSCSPAAAASINPGELMYFNTAMVECNGEIVRAPDPIVKMVWFTDSATKTEVQWQEGSKAVFEIEKTGIGNTYLDDWIDVYIQSSQKKAFSVMTDLSGTEYTDNNGNVYINN